MLSQFWQIFGESRRRVVLCSLIGAIVSSWTSVSAQPLLDFQPFPQNAALPSAYVTSLAVDKYGRILIGTRRGLARFDGLTVETITVADGLASNDVVDVLVDRFNRLWIAHGNGTITIIEDGNSRVLALPNDNKEDVVITCLYEDNRGNIWVGTLGNGAFIIKDSITHLTQEKGLSGTAVFAFLQDSQQRIWIGTDQGITIIPSLDSLFLPTSWIAVTLSDGLPDRWVRALIEDNRGRIWIGTREGGLARYEPLEQVRGRNPWKYYTKRNGLPENFVIRLALSQENNLWIGTYGGGVALLDLRTGKLIQNRKMQDVGNLYVMDIVEDRERQVWIATFGGAIVIAQPSVIRQFTKKEKLPGNNVHGIFDDGETGLWIGTDEGLAFVQLPIPVLGSPSIRVIDYAFALDDLGVMFLRDSLQRKWMLSPDGQLYRIARGSVENKYRLPAFRIRQAFIDAENRLWLADEQRGVLVYSLDGERIAHLPVDPSFGQVRWITYSPTGKIVVLTEKFLLRVKDQQLEIAVPKLRLEGKNPLVAAYDLSGSIWIGTNGWGLFQIDTQQNVSSFTQKQGLISDVITALYFDEELGCLWIGTNQGFMQYDLKNGLFYPYGVNEGFPAMEVNPHGFAKDRFGNLWIGSVSGAYLYSSKDRDLWVVEPQIVITRARITGIDSLIASGAEIDYAFNDITIEYAGISLRQPRALYYQYMLEGIDSTWSKPVKYRSVRYTDLLPGLYTFKVRAGYLYGKWSSNPAIFQFVIHRPWWQQLWVYFVFIAAFALVVSAAIAYRNHRIQQINRRLEQEVARKTAALLNKNRELEFLVAELQKAKEEAEQANEAKMQLFAQVTHELRTPLNIILGFTRRLLRKIAQQEARDEELKALKAVYRNAEILLSHINSILELTRLEAQVKQIEYEEVDIKALLSAVVSEFSPIIEGFPITIHVQSEPVRCLTNRRMLDQILKNLLSNAIKNTESGHIHIIANLIEEKGKKLLTIDVQDTGRGIPEDMREKIFEPFQQVSSDRDTASLGGIGLGLSIAREFARTMGGDLQLLESHVGVGSTFRIVLPYRAVEDSPAMAPAAFGEKT